MWNLSHSPVDQKDLKKQHIVTQKVKFKPSNHVKLPQSHNNMLTMHTETKQFD